MHILIIKVQWPQMTPKWPLTPDFFGEHVHPFPSNPVSFRWWKNIICQQTEKCFVYELWAFENSIFLYFTCKRSVKNCRIALIIQPIRSNFGYVMRNLKLIIWREKNNFKKLWPQMTLACDLWVHEHNVHHFVGKQSPLNVKMKKAFLRQK